ncbi:hypothetical protein AB0I61_32385 [Polymorphospora rubra]|uniref:hypothetical protein n=1 Tax=Polymorphospora rubra TaxID=338584 RepID=UPI0033F063AF
MLIDDVAPEPPGGSAAPGDRAGGANYAARSHMFIPAFVGTQAAAEIAQRNRLEPATEQWFDCYKAPLDLYGGGGLYVWPFGVAMFHVVEDLELPDLAALAVWRQRTYQDKLRWATRRLRDLHCDDIPEALYVFSLYWMAQPIWSGDTLQAALRILSMPKVLLRRDEDADIEQVSAVEQALLANGFDHPEIVQFGVAGISVGCASWSAISYHPLQPSHALAEQEAIVCELATQALWTYSAHINAEAENGRDPQVPDRYDWRFLRAMRSRLTNARPQESGQHRSMRNAVIETSGIVNHLDHAIDILRESAGSRT